jgi:hypothetical protein
MTRQDIPIKVKFSLKIHLIARLCDLCQSRHCLFIPVGQGVIYLAIDNTERLTGMAVEITKKLAHFLCFGTEPFYTVKWQLWQSVFASITAVKYLSSVCLFVIHEPHESLLTLLHITAIAPRGN